ncbi:hypothetical protein GXB85_05505 [Cellulomonas sp. APG4]|uniref:hypothetical protein n=1 Tax=Cellulomonas sp. APG4 TaxID=1538656 RepID=UPI0013797E2A|nr:hypothetical protein [Cellulomonas sp. APG4]NCT90407.1 hypothetical protein [Cellulomonas sp. APG4]
MSEGQRERATVGVNVPMSSGAGMSASVGVAAPIGAVSRRDKERAARTSLARDGSALVLRTELPGTVMLQRRSPGATWETLDSRATARQGSTRLELPQDTPAGVFRVVFSPKNANITTWISADVEV